MKKSLIVLCGAAISLAAFAEPAEGPAPCACDPAKPACECKGEGCQCAQTPAPAPQPKRMERRERGGRPNLPAPTMLKLDENTTPEQIEEFKQKVLAKIDSSVAAYAEKPADKKTPTTMILFVNDRPFGQGMGPRGQGMGGQRERRRGPGEGGRRGMGPRGPRGERPGAPAPAPAPAAE